LIEGEPGSGKTVIAKTLHALSQRHRGPFVTVNCKTFPRDSLGQALFGSEPGSSPPDRTAQWGLIAKADGGVLFLDEIGELSGPVQVRLLEVLDRGEYCPVGGSQSRPANVRFIAATTQNLQDLVLAGQFRDDLLYRISSVTLKVPALRERPADIPVLAKHFLNTFSSKHAPPRAFSQEAWQLLISYSWPGNVCELRTVIERLLQAHPGQARLITREELSALLSP
jgi:DNA-binding NtrC family response regulator